MARALASCKNNKAVCRVLNTNPYVVTLKKGLKLAKIAGLIDSVLSMCEISQPQSSARSSSSSGERKQTCNDVTAEAKATARSIDKSMCSGNQVTDVGVATDARTVNQHDLDTFHKEYGFKLSPQLDDAQHLCLRTRPD